MILDGWVDEWLDGFRMGGWMNECVGGKVLWVGGWMAGWLAGWLAGWMDGWMNESDGCTGLEAANKAGVSFHFTDQ